MLLIKIINPIQENLIQENLNPKKNLNPRKPKSKKTKSKKRLVRRTFMFKENLDVK